MRRKTWILGGLAAVGGVTLLAWAFAPRPLEVETGVADHGPFETVIAEEGRTRLRARYIVSAPLAGQLERIALEAGDRVAAGDVVAQLQPAMSPMLDERTRRELTARVAAAQAHQQRAGSQAEAARVSLAQARSAQQRSGELARQGFVSPVQAEADALAVDAAQKTLDAALQGRSVAGHELEMARAALAAAGGMGGGGRSFALRAPIAGQVLRVLQASAGTVGLGTPLLELGDTAQLEVVAELLTSDALQAGVGRPVRIEAWGGAGVLAGRVRRVEPAGFTKVSALGVEEQRVLVHIDLTSPRAEWQALGDGYRVGVRIVTRQVADALRVPVSAVFPRPEGGHAVFVVEGGRARLQPVSLAVRNATHAWLNDGLAAGLAVVIYPPAALADGSVVRLRRP
jgi:HlyD family secretion protein